MYIIHKITVSPYEIELTPNSASETYDGTEKSVSGFETLKVDGSTYTVSGFEALEFEVDGSTYTVSGLTAGVRGTDARWYPVEVSGQAVVTDSDGNDVTGQFAVSVDDVMLTIARRPVTLTSASDSKEYDGTPLTNDGVTVSGDGWVEGQGAACSVAGSASLPGETAYNTFTYTLNEGTKAENYKITMVEGTLTITDRAVKYEIAVEANSDAVVYDGSEHTVSGMVGEASYELGGQEVSAVEVSVGGLKFYVVCATSGASAADATGEEGVANSFVGEPAVLDAQGNDVTGQFKVATVAGKLVIAPRPVTLASADLTRAYNGSPLTNAEAASLGAAVNENGLLAEQGWVEGQGAAYSFTGSQKIVGSSDNVFECIPDEGTNLDNYQITKRYGTLTVTDRAESEKYQIALTPNSASETYDGTEKSVSGFEALEFEVDGSTYTVSGLTAGARGTDAGEYPVKVSGQAVVTDSDGNDVTGQFAVSVGDATLTIVKADQDTPADPDKPSSDNPPKTTEPAPKLPETGDDSSAPYAPYAMGVCGAAMVAAGAAAFVARRKYGSGE